MKTVKDVLTCYINELSTVYDLKEIEAITLLVLSDLLATSKAKLKAFPETDITAYAQRLENILQQLKTGKPIQYILGHTEFYGLPFYVNPSVLIPRPETEELVQWIIESIKSYGKPVQNLLDIGTGSGCIPISLKENKPNIQIFAIDISTDALDTAKKNAQLNNVEINFMEADILNPAPAVKLPKLDIIVSNPPYVTLTDKRQMHQNVTNFEPHTALFVPEDDPLIFYKAITRFAKQYLTENGMLFFEINENYGRETVEMMQNNLFKNIELRKDLSGRDRMIRAEI